jgi:hypothetical protein
MSCSSKKGSVNLIPAGSISLGSVGLEELMQQIKEEPLETQSGRDPPHETWEPIN